jgi:hypothetical protein
MRDRGPASEDVKDFRIPQQLEAFSNHIRTRGWSC